MSSQNEYLNCLRVKTLMRPIKKSAASICNVLFNAIQSVDGVQFLID